MLETSLEEPDEEMYEADPDQRQTEIGQMPKSIGCVLSDGPHQQHAKQADDQDSCHDPCGKGPNPDEDENWNPRQVEQNDCETAP